MRGQAVRDPLTAVRPLGHGPGIASQQVECFFDGGELTHDPRRQASRKLWRHGRQIDRAVQAFQHTRRCGTLGGAVSQGLSGRPVVGCEHH